MLKPITSLEDIEVGQLVNDGKKTKKVLAKSGLLVWLSLAENFDEVCGAYTIYRMIDKQMKVVEEELVEDDKLERELMEFAVPGGRLYFRPNKNFQITRACKGCGSIKTTKA